MTRSTSARGQAVVEMALITPILLLLILGVIQSGFAMLTSLQLQHAAQQAVSDGADEPAVPQRCTVARSTAATVYGSEPDSVECSLTGGVLELQLADDAPVLGPFGSWTIRASARAMTP